MVALLAVALAPAGVACAQVGSARAVAASEHVHVKAEPWRPGRVVEVSGSVLLDLPIGSELAESEAAWSGWLSNGVRVHAVPMAAAPGAAALRLVIAREACEGDGTRDLMLARASAAMLNDMAASGAPKRAFEAAGWVFNANAWDGAVTINADGPGGAASVEQAVRTIAAMLDRPSWTSAGLTRWREKSKALMDAGASEPRTALNTAIEELMGLPALDAVVLDAPIFDDAQGVADWLGSRAGRGPMSAAIAGDIDRGETMQSMAEWLGGLGGGLGGGMGGGTERVQERARMAPEMPEPWEPAEVERTVVVRAVPGAPAMVLRGVVGPPSDRLDTARRLRQASQLLEARSDQLLAERGLASSGVASGMIFGDRHGGRSLAWVVVAVEPSMVGVAREALDEAFSGIDSLTSTPEAIAVLRASTAEEIAMLTRSPAYWADRLTASDVTGLPVVSASALREAYTSITGEQIAEAMEAFGGSKHRVSLTITPGVRRERSTGSGSR